MKLLKIALLATFLFLLSFHNAWAAAVMTETPLGVLPGDAVTVTWSGLAVTTPRDWIALYPAGGGRGSYRYYIYTSCLRTPGSTAPPAGTCPFPILSVLPFGTYELRLLANDTETVLATSNQFNIGPLALRFVDNGDHTITDNQTGLMWEMKGDGIICDPSYVGPLAIHCVNNTYTWSATGSAPDGTLFTDFLARINAELSTSADGITVAYADVCFAGHCDWRIPDIAELQTISLDSPIFCSTFHCIDPAFGPTARGVYWSVTTMMPPMFADSPFFDAWVVDFVNAGVFPNWKWHSGDFFARAVRGGR